MRQTVALVTQTKQSCWRAESAAYPLFALVTVYLNEFSSQMAELTDQTRRLLLRLLQKALESDTTTTASTATHHPPSQWFGNNDRMDVGGGGMLGGNSIA